MEVQIEIPHGENNGDSNQTPSGRSIPQSASVDAPEKKLTLFAQRLAIIKITATRLGQLAFIWGSVILVGGFVSNLKPKDFWFVTAIVVVVEATRLFTRSCEFEWQYQSTRTLPANNSRCQNQSHLSQPSRRLAYNMQTKWTFLLADVPLVPYWLQIFVAATCVALSLMQLGQQDYGDDAQINEKSALNVFYGLVLADGLMFLLGNGYWAWRIKHGKLVEWVSKDYEGLIDMAYLWRFCYDAYSQCIDGSIFNGLKMDLVSFAEDLLHSDSPEKQIIGARILQQLVENPGFAADTLRKIGSSKPVIKRLIEMLNFKDTLLRRLASKIVLKIALEKQEALLVAAIPGAIESIASLLHTGGDSTDGTTYEASLTAVIVDKEDFKLLGLLILENLAKYHDNCQKIGNSPGLLAKIIDLTRASEALLRDEPVPELQIKPVHQALQVVKILTTATGKTGKILRRDISEIAYLASNIKEILEHGQSHLKLQMLGLQILTSLAMNEEAREKIVETGSMLSLIVGVFFRPIVPEEVEVGAVCNEAGEALAMLLESWRNCKRMLRIKNVVSRLVNALDDPALRVNAMRILRCLCSYTDLEQSDRLLIVGRMPMVLRKIMEEQENEKFLEASLGIAIKILKFRNAEDLLNPIPMARIIDEDFLKDFVKKIVEILNRYENPKCEVPRMRIFVIELAIHLMKYNRSCIELFRNLRMEQILMRTTKTASNFEFLPVKSANDPFAYWIEADISFWVEKACKLLGE